MARIILVIMLLYFSVACESRSEVIDAGEQLDITDVNGQGSVAMSLKDTTVKGVIVYFHGMEQLPDVIYKNPHHRALFTPLLHAGYVVVAAEAAGSAFGNPSSVADYRALLVAAEAKYHQPAKLFVAESMGALASLALYAEDQQSDVKGMVGITPLMGIPPEDGSIDFVAKAWPGGVPESADPMEWDTKTLAGRHFLLYQADQDDVIPAGARASDFATRFGSVSDIRVAACAGGHVDPDCYDADGVRAWVNALGL